ncbi:angiopoietin-related protein 7-like [Anopheles ziemanni]|uniref:angiopoietin-related protein 7-like n=1 Tax=Anopheles coustani TaxID=139045 RepID=UPI002659F8F4|nr:angiopoietin-related protein 7-like [Anopheles coustani]XP_058123192.1 angiopoietin-related protein 7-like [Anopheles coustani]XP_058178277.1 angiopoietin-related protein 7-like [Anopheles ziemanni]XP_058178279.1 angiopoietin-related protein 7-like [Anopheles ziemanni]
MDLLIGKLDKLQEKLLDIERNQRPNESYRNLEAAESGSKTNENDLRAKLEEMERSSMVRHHDLERKLDKMEREMMASKIVYLQDKLQDIEQMQKTSESFRAGPVKSAEPSTYSKKKNLLDGLERRMTAKEAFLQNKLEEIELENKTRDEKLRCLEEKLHDIEQNLKRSISYAPSEASTKAIEDDLCNKLDDMEQCITADENVVQSNPEEVEQLSTDSNLQKRLTEVEKSMKAKEDTLNEAVQFFKETEKKLTTQFNNLDKTLDEELENLRDQWSKVSDLQKVVNSLVDSNKYCLDITMKRGGKHRLAFNFNQSALVYCDHTKFGDGWLVFQHRYNGEVDFFRGWADYREGFGNLDGEFWLGLEHLHKLTSVGKYQLLVEMEDHAGKYGYAKYDQFKVRSENDRYKLEVGCYSGTIEDSMQYSNGGSFYTKDKQSSCYSAYNPVTRHGAWWDSPSYQTCVNLNGSYQYPSDKSKAMSWHCLNYRGMAFTRMMIRKVSL